MSTLKEIGETVRLLRKYNVPFILMQCTSEYPCPYEDVNLGAIKTLKRKFRVPVGLSDHSLGIYTALGAVALGACAIEKHITIDKNWSGPDQKLSLEPHELKALVEGARAIYLASGTKKNILHNEIPVLNFARECVVATKDIAP